MMKARMSNDESEQGLAQVLEMLDTREAFGLRGIPALLEQFCLIESSTTPDEQISLNLHTFVIRH